MGCINNCKNPIFFFRRESTAGTCVETGEGEYECICEEGYNTRNVLDQPVCESASTTAWLYGVVIFVSAVSILLSIYHRRRQRGLLKATGVTYDRWSLQDTMRSRMYVCGMISGSLLIFHFTLLICGVLTFTQSLPFFAADHFMISELGLVSVETWISLLPRSLLKPQTLAFRICGLVQNGKHLWLISVPFTSLYILGTAIGFFDNPVLCRYILQGTIIIQILYTITIIDIVAYSLLSVMRDAKLRTVPSLSKSGALTQARTYDDVMVQLKWMTFGANGLMSFFLLVSSFSLFSPAGRRSPLLFYSCLHGFGISFWQIFSVTILAPKGSRQVLPNRSNAAEGTRSTGPQSPRKLGNTGSTGNVTRTTTSTFVNTTVSSIATTANSIALTAKRTLHSPRGTYSIQSPRGTHTRISVSPRNTGTFQSSLGAAQENVMERIKKHPSLLGGPSVVYPQLPPLSGSHEFKKHPSLMNGSLENIIVEKPRSNSLQTVTSSRSRLTLDTIFADD